MNNLVQLRRHDTSTPWGFRMNGGVEFGQPLHIQKVTPNSISYKAGLLPDDILLQIGQSPTHRMTHEQAKMEIIRAGNEVNFIIQRDPSRNVDLPPASVPVEAPRSPQGQVEPAWRSGGPTQNPRVQSRSFTVLQHQLATE